MNTPSTAENGSAAEADARNGDMREETATPSGRGGAAAVGFYQTFVSAPLHLLTHAFGLVPAACRFEPTCSEYARVAMLRHGIVRGSALSVRRVLRCRPGAPGGYDPVPPLV